MNTNGITVLLSATLLTGLFAAIARADESPVPVTVKTFVRAETDMYFASTVKRGGFGKFDHNREPTPVDEQDVVRMNRDTLYSGAVFDLDAGPVTITLPETGKRFMSLLIINEDHYAQPVVYAPGSYTFTKDQIGTRYVMAVVRTLIDADKPDDVKAANGKQDEIKVQQAAVGTFEIPNWDLVSQKKIRDPLTVLGTMQGRDDPQRFGLKDEVNPIDHLIGTAFGWGGNPPAAAKYVIVQPAQNDGKTVYTLTVKDVPVDGFWSITVYNSEGFLEKNEPGVYSINNITGRPNADGSFTIQFGGDPKSSPNVIPTTPGWNYTARLYRPRKEILDGTWKFPEASPVK